MTAKHLLSEIVALTVDWDGTDMKDTEHTRTEITCGDIRALVAYVEQLEKALEPFAKAAEKADAHAERMGFAPSFDAYAPTWTFSFGELRRARAALGGSNE